jgi:hypothetical protein
MTRTDIRELLGKHKSSEEIGRALSVLEEYGMAKSVNEPTAGRTIERWFAAHVQGAR